MKKIAGPLRMNLAQYREMAVFAQFGSDLDEATRNKLMQGERLFEVLKQPQYSPYEVEDQIVLLYAAVNGYLMDVEKADVKKFNEGLIAFVENTDRPLLDAILKEKQLTPELEEKLKADVIAYKESLS